MADYVIPDTGGSADQELLKLPKYAQIQGGAGDDIIRIGWGSAIPMAGNNTVIGYNGSRQDQGETLPWVQVSYNYSPTGIYADLETGKIKNGFGGIDSVSGINFISGSNFSDSFITGSQEFITYVGTPGNDNYKGGNGYSRVVYWGKSSTEAQITYDKTSDTFTVVKGFFKGELNTDTLVGISQIDFLYQGADGRVGDGKSFTRADFDNSYSRKITLDAYGEDYYNNKYYISNLFEDILSPIKPYYKQSITTSSEDLTKNVLFSWDYGSDSPSHGSFLWTSVMYNPYGELTPINKIHDHRVDFSISLYGQVDKYNSSIHFNLWDKNKKDVFEIAINIHWPWERIIEGASKTLNYQDGDFSGTIFVHMLPITRGQTNITLIPSKDVLSGTFDIKKFLNFLINNNIIDENLNIISTEIGCEGHGVASVLVNKFVVTQTENTFPIFSNNNFQISVGQDKSYSFKVNASDIEGDKISYALAENPSRGNIIIGSDGSFTYTPMANYSGTDRFSVTASDGFGGTATQTINVTVLSNGIIEGTDGNDSLVGSQGVDALRGVKGNDTIDGGSNVDTVIVSGSRSSYTLAQTATGVWSVSGPDGNDTLTNVEYLQFDDQKVRLVTGTGTTVSFQTDSPGSYMSAIRDFDGNDLGAAASWKRIGAADINGDGDIDQVFVNRDNGRFATVGTAPDGKVYFSDHGWAGETRVVGIYVDPLVQAGKVTAGSDNDSQRRLQNDLRIDNISKVLGAGDYDKDGRQEVYFALNDGTAYLHAYMHADGNIQYANYQSKQQVIDFLSSNGWAATTYAGWFG